MEPSLREADEITEDFLLAHAKEIWLEAAYAVSRDPSEFEARVVKCRIVAGTSRIVLGLFEDDDPSYILKVQYPPIMPDRFREEVAAHKRAEAGFQAVEGQCVPKLHWSDDAAQAILLDHVEGHDFHETMLVEGLDATLRAARLKEAGAWLSQLHQTTISEEVVFRPQRIVEAVQTMAQEVRAGELNVPRPKRFLGLAAAHFHAAQKGRGAITRRTNLHGDFHMRNLIVAETGLFGIDFSAREPGYAAYDLARFFYRFALSFGTSKSAANFGICSEDWEAFEAGYGQTLRDDPAFRPLFLRQLIRDWANLPAVRGSMTRQQRTRFEEIIELTDCVLGQG